MREASAALTTERIAIQLVGAVLSTEEVSPLLDRILIATAIVVACADSAAAQADMVCDQSGMTKLETDVNSITDATKKEMVTKEMAMVKEAMAANDAQKCKTHMENAMKARTPCDRPNLTFERRVLRSTGARRSPTA